MRDTLPEDARPPETADADDPTVGQTPAPAAPLSRARAYAPSGVKRPWSAAAALCLIAAAVLGSLGRLDATFVVATLGVVAWFLDQRNLLRARGIEADADEESTGIEEQDEQ